MTYHFPLKTIRNTCINISNDWKEPVQNCMRYRLLVTYFQRCTAHRLIFTQLIASLIVLKVNKWNVHTIVELQGTSNCWVIKTLQTLLIKVTRRQFKVSKNYCTFIDSKQCMIKSMIDLFSRLVKFGSMKHVIYKNIGVS